MWGVQRSTATVILLFPTPVAQNKTMAGSDKRGASDLLANPRKAANSPQLAGPGSAHDFSGWTPAQRPSPLFPILKLIVQGPKV